jgi:transposase
MDNTRRYVGIDLGKRTYTVALIAETGKVSFSNGRTSLEGRQGLYGKLRSTDKVALEAGNLAFQMAYEIKARVGCQVVVLNSNKLPLIYGSMKKTDKEDSLKLARMVQMMSDEQLPSVPLPNEEETRRGSLIAGWLRAKRCRTRMINLLHGMFMHRGITTIVKKDLSTKERREAVVGLLSGLEAQEAAWILKSLEVHEARLEELKKRMEEERQGDERIERLEGVAGVGPLVALAFLAFVGDAVRFENASQVSNYLGLVPRVDISGTIVRYGGITKRGNRYLRSLLVQAAWALLRSHNGGALRDRYWYMTQEKGLGKKKTIIAIARRLAELLYTLLRDGSEYEVRPFRGGKSGAEGETEGQKKVIAG